MPTAWLQIRILKNLRNFSVQMVSITSHSNSLGYLWKRIQKEKIAFRLKWYGCLTTESGMPPSFWGEPVNTVNYLRNGCLSRTLDGTTRFKMWIWKELQRVWMKCLQTYSKIEQTKTLCTVKEREKAVKYVDNGTTMVNIDSCNNNHPI